MGSSLTCHYCHRPILPDDDAQRIDRYVVAHTHCAWAIEDEVWNHKDSIFNAVIGALIEGLILQTPDQNEEDA